MRNEAWLRPIPHPAPENEWENSLVKCECSAVSVPKSLSSWLNIASRKAENLLRTLTLMWKRYKTCDKPHNFPPRPLRGSSRQCLIEFVSVIPTTGGRLFSCPPPIFFAICMDHCKLFGLLSYINLIEVVMTPRWRQIDVILQWFWRKIRVCRKRKIKPAFDLCQRSWISPHWDHWVTWDKYLDIICFDVFSVFSVFLFARLILSKVQKYSIWGLLQCGALREKTTAFYVFFFLFLIKALLVSLDHYKSLG